MPVTIEIKARCERHGTIRKELQSAGADFHGTDHQVDTYFNVRHGRLKLREGNIENHLIQYQRPDQKGSKLSEVVLLKTGPGSPLKRALTNAVGVLTVVDKSREIYFIDNVKFHLDTVKGLGRFVEIEAIDRKGELPIADLQQQCERYMELFGIEEADLVEASYSDMVMEQTE